MYMCYPNSSLFYQIENVVNDCDEALRLEPSNIKALFRRGQAHKSLKMYAKSVEDLETLLKLDPKNAAARKELQIAKKSLELVSNIFVFFSF